MNLTLLILKRIVVFLVLLITLGACKDDPVVIDPPIIEPPVVVNTDSAQYGTPFANVPDARDAVIYQVNMRSFSNTRNFQGVIARLDSIRALGVNVIYLMPIFPVGALKSINSPYCIKDYQSVNSQFGTLKDLRTLIDGAHSRGISVILDWVANHTSWDNAWINTPAWYVQNTAGLIQSPNGWNDVAQLNFNNTDMRKAMIKAMKNWVLAANCDGFRCDYADSPPANFWKQAIDTLRNIKTHKLLIMAEGSRADHFNAGFDFTFGFGFYGQLKSIFSSNQPVTNIDNLNNTEYTNAGTNNMVVRYLTNHDVNSSDGTALDLFGGKSGSMAAFVVVAYMKGVPMIYNGQEVGTSYRLTFPFTGTPINWNQNQSMVEEYKKIITFRNKSVAIRRGILTSYSNAGICAFTKTIDTETVFVVSNLRNSTINYALPPTVAETVWKDAFTGTSVAFNTQLTLSPYLYQVFTK
jgi:glycosidase